MLTGVAWGRRGWNTVVPGFFWMGRDFDVVLAPAGVASTTLSAGIGLGRARREGEHSASRMPRGTFAATERHSA